MRVKGRITGLDAQFVCERLSGGGLIANRALRSATGHRDKTCPAPRRRHSLGSSVQVGASLERVAGVSLVQGPTQNTLCIVRALTLNDSELPQACCTVCLEPLGMKQCESLPELFVLNLGQDEVDHWTVASDDGHGVVQGVQQTVLGNANMLFGRRTWLRKSCPEREGKAGRTVDHFR